MGRAAYGGARLVASGPGSGPKQAQRTSRRGTSGSNTFHPSSSDADTSHYSIAYAANERQRRITAAR